MSRFVATTRAARGPLLLAAFLTAVALWAPPKASSPVVSSPSSAVPSDSPAYLFLSPNVDEGVSPEEALRRARSPEQVRFKGVAEDILRQVGIAQPCVLDALGDWADGSENSLLAVIPNPPDRATLRYAAGWFGLLAQQKEVLAFRPAANGPDAVCLLDLPHPDLHQLRFLLDAHGVRFRTLIPRTAGHRVIVYDEGRRLHSALERLAALCGTPCRTTPGYGETIGEATRDQALARYRAVIDAYEETRRPRYRPSPLPPLVRLAPSR